MIAATFPGGRNGKNIMASTQSETILTALHYLFTPTTDGKMIAHCLDLDLVTSGKNIDEAEDRLNATVLVQIGTCYVAGNFAQLRFKAPAEYWQALSDAKELEKKHLEVEVPPVVLPVSRSAVTLAVYRSEKAMAAAA
jgi:hypothetical protein